MTPKSGRVIAWLSFLLGIGVSIAGNIGHAASDGMLPGEWAGATFWPLALMLSIEILTRVRWQRGKRWVAARIIALVVVAAVAAVLSYRHLAGLMTYWGEDWLNAHLGPLAVDGLMLIAATALLSISKERDVAAPSSDHRHVFQWPEPIGPKTARDVALDRMAKGLDLPEWVADEFKGDPERWRIWEQNPVQLIGAMAPKTPEPVVTPDDDPAPEPERKLHVVEPVTEDSAEIQSWIKDGLSLAEIAARMNVSKSTAHRRVKAHERRIQGR